MNAKSNPEPSNQFVASLTNLLKQYKLGSEEQRINALKGVEILAYAGGGQFEQVRIYTPK